jgi:hypothetical protein
MIPHLSTISHVDRLASQTKNDKLAMALTVMSVALVATMAVKEFRSLFEDRERRRGEDRGR